MNLLRELWRMARFFGIPLLAILLIVTLTAQSNQGSVTRYNVPLGLGPGFTGWNVAAPGVSGTVLCSQGAASFPIFSTCGIGSGSGTVTSLAAGTGITLTPDPITTTGTVALTTPVTVPNGGTGNTTFINHGLLVGQGASAVSSTSAGTLGQPICAGGTFDPFPCSQLGNLTLGNITLQGTTTLPGSGQISSTGSIGIGSPPNQNYGGGVIPVFQINGTTQAASNLGFSTWNATGTTAPNFLIAKSNGAAIGTHGIVSSGDRLGTLIFRGDDGVQFQTAGYIRAYVDATPGVNDMPGRLCLATTPDGTASAVENLCISNAGVITLTGEPKFSFGNTTGGGSAALGSNSPASTLTAPYTWFTVLSSDGSTVYVPAWK